MEDEMAWASYGGTALLPQVSHVLPSSIVQGRGNKEVQFDISQHDVVFAENEETFRLAAVDTLTGFGFQSSRVHGVEDVHAAVSKTKELQAMYSKEHKLPVIVFLPPSGGPIFSQEKFKSSYYLVSASDAATIVTEAVDSDVAQGSWHCKVPRKLDKAVLLAWSEIFQAWWTAELAKEERMRKFHETAAKKKAEKAARSYQGKREPLKFTEPAGPRPQFNRHPDQQAQSTHGYPSAPSPFLDDQGSPESDQFHQVFSDDSSTMVKFASITSQDSDVTFPSSISSDKGNSTLSLALLRPAKSPFEDVTILRRVGVGAFGSVYKARWEASIVALKVVKYDGTADVTKATFEGALTSSLAHPGLVKTFKHSMREQENGHGYEVWMVQEFCGMGTVLSQCKETLAKGFPCIVEVSCEIASAASYLHSRGIIHGDLSGNNVLYANTGHSAKGFVAKICDFGLARVLGTSESLETRSMGTVSSMPPELFQMHGAALTAKVDVYAFGILLYVLCSGNVPFAGMAIQRVIVEVAKGSKPELPPSVPEHLATLYHKSTSKVPKARPDFEKIVHVLLKIMLKAS
eukprot:gnl/MRDRNA2_/MRDRNA2_84082_c0_seq1.p1 gnl/MRDRNA2_/MRDRNA2_84082_c0~~gnl/MRDRNA2_/MRDRNA2_84082_c0_seq1.p1  ORF type:complete len:574 (+),score=76.93 gnl/MRDRNA2_/MRDRNA2_84082_c0_seq1:115-1836(+)